MRRTFFVFISSLILISCGSKKDGEDANGQLNIRSTMGVYEKSVALEACMAMDYKRKHILLDHSKTLFPFSYTQKSCSGAIVKSNQNTSRPLLFKLTGRGDEFVISDTKNKDYDGKVFRLVQDNRNGELSALCEIVESNQQFNGRFETIDRVTQFSFSKNDPREISVRIIKGKKIINTSRFQKDEQYSYIIYSSNMANPQNKIGFLKSQEYEKVCGNRVDSFTLKAVNLF